MKPRTLPFVFVTAIICFSMLLAVLPGSVMPSLAQGPQPPTVIPPEAPLEGPDWQTAPNGQKFSSDDRPATARAAALAPQSMGGPDEFGYVWDDSIPLNWIDAVAGGTDTGMSGYAGAVSVALPFSFHYYENAYSTLYIVANGYVGFTDYGYWPTQAEIPSPATPNNVIAPYWTPIYLNAGGPAGRVYYKSGGTAPNRYFVVEWYNVKGGDPSDTIGGDDTYRFEVILYENGNIDFQYQTMTTTGSSWWCGSAGIEDSTGLVGLANMDFCYDPPVNIGVRFTRPAPAARVNVNPPAAGLFSPPGGVTQFNLTVRNIGDLGTDTYDLFPSSIWPLSLYEQSGTVLLSDTNGNGTIDTGPIPQGSSRTIVAKVNTPAAATIGQSSTGQLTFRSSLNTGISKVVPVNVAVPAAFAQSFQQYNPHVGFYRHTGQIIQPTTTSYGYYPAVATTPDGNVVQVWNQSRTNSNGKYIREVYYAVLDRYGNITRPATRITDNSAATLNTYDYYPAVAVSPNGNVAVIWYRYLYNSTNSTSNYNIFYKVLNSSGGTVKAITSLTNNSVWGTSSALNVPRFYNPTIAATTGNRFVMAWQKYLRNTSTTYAYTVWYAAADSAGALLKAQTQFGTDTRSYEPNLTPLADGSAFLSFYSNGKITYGRLAGNGNVLTSPTWLSGAYGYSPDAVQLPNGNLAVAWSNWGVIQYAMLNSGLGLITGPTYFPKLSSVSDDYPSVTYSGNRAVITWGDGCCDYQPNLYYALIDGVGNLLTPPMIFASDNANYALELPYNGQGNTYLPGADDVTPPTNPTPSSNDHTVNVWSNDNTINLAWPGASDGAGSGVDGYSYVWDTSPSTVPDTSKDAEAATTSMTVGPVADGTSGYFHIRTVDAVGNWASGATHLGPFKIDATPPKSSAYSSPFAIGQFNVTWSGTDAGSGIASYNIWVRDGLAGAWTKWLNATTATSAAFTSGIANHTYYFRSEARDVTGNIETDLPAAGDSQTTVANYAITGGVYNNRHQAVFNAALTLEPVSLNTVASDGRGQYTGYLVNVGAYTLTASRADFGPLPPQYNLHFNGTASVTDFVLPPLNDAIANGGWETGDFTSWMIDPGITATVELTAAHTGDFGLRLDLPVSVLRPNQGNTNFYPVLTQTLAVAGTRPTLSYLYRVIQGSGDLFSAKVEGASGTLSQTITLTPGNWTHTWLDLTPFTGQTITLTFGVENLAAVEQIQLDEISVGDTQIGVYPIFLPLLKR